MAVINAVPMGSDTITVRAKGFVTLGGGATGPSVASLDSLTPVSGFSLTVTLDSAVVSDSTWEDESNYVITGGGQTLTVLSAVPGGATTDTITLTTSGQVAGVTYTLAISGLTNVNNGTDTFTGLTTNTTISRIVQVEPLKLMVRFSSPMLQNMALRSRSNYNLTGLSVLGVRVIDTDRVLLEISGNPTTSTGTLTVYGLTDIYGNTVDNVSNTWGTLTGSVSTVSVESLRKIRLNLAGPTRVDSEWRDTSNFTVTRVSNGSPVVVASVQEDSLEGTAIELLLGADPVVGQSYNVAWAGLKTVAPSNLNWTAVASRPYLQSLVWVSPNAFELTFSESMADNAALVNPANYTLSSGVSLVFVSRKNSTQVVVGVGFAFGVRSGSITVSGPQNTGLTATCTASRKAFVRAIF